MGCGDELPSDIIFEILTRTSLHTLDQCKAVSKNWNKMIYEPTFLSLHSQRTNLFGYFFQDVKLINKYPSALISPSAGAAAAAVKSTWPCDSMKILASSDQGILCCERQICYNKRFYACKPVTGQWQALPNPKLRYGTDAVAVTVVSSRPLRYLITRLYTSGLQHHGEVFDSAMWAWEKIGCAAPYGEVVIAGPAVTTAGRYVHWLTWNDIVLTLDLKRRCFRCSPLPEATRCNAAYKWKKAVEYEGGVGFMCLVEDGDKSDMELWVGGEKKIVVDMGALAELVHHPHPVPVDFCNGVLFMRTGDGGALYDVQNDKFSKLEVPHEVRNPHQIFRFRSNLDVVDLRSGRFIGHGRQSNSPSRLTRTTSAIMLLLFVSVFVFRWLLSFFYYYYY